jgi:hypothetical protein
MRFLFLSENKALKMSLKVWIQDGVMVAEQTVQRVSAVHRGLDSGGQLVLLC